MDRICSFPVFRASAQGGDRYPKHGTDQSDRTLPQNRRRSGGIGQAGIRCSRRRSNPTNQISELPHNPEIGTSGCGHRNNKRKKQETGLINGLHLASFYLPSNRFAVASTDSKKTLAPAVSKHRYEFAHFFDIPLLLFAVPVHEILCPHSEVPRCLSSANNHPDRQPNHSCTWVSCPCRRIPSMPGCGQPVRYIVNLLVSSIPLIELGGFQNLPWGAQCETMYE